MAISRLKERYRVDLPALQACCESNYLRLTRLLPNMRERIQSRYVALSQGAQHYGVLHLEVLECCPYTTTLALSQPASVAWLPTPTLKIRVYHDARMAEVIEANQAKHFAGRYQYPNPSMHQPDEKTQLNAFLSEWLAHCLQLGHEFEAVG